MTEHAVFDECGFSSTGGDFGTPI